MEVNQLEMLKNKQLSGVKKFSLKADLVAFPRELFDLVDTLEILDLSDNQLTTLPADFGRFKKLKIAFFSNNNFENFPAVLADCPSLTMISFKGNQLKEIPENALPLTTQWLILTQNLIKTLPNSIGNCENLEKVALAGNLIEELPDSMANCKKLGLLRISANRLNVLPKWLLELPKMTWLAFAGNPCAYVPESKTKISKIDWLNLEPKEVLGQGASGVISKAIYCGQEEVAIKLFKGEVTSDGYPEDELTICLSAGVHPNLVPLRGEIVNHSDGKKGIVLDLIPANYKVLGYPPSFDSCTRDVFPSDLKLTSLQVENILTGIKAAIEHLHGKGILHGDIYAHNILYNEEGHAYLGDFGAATFFNPTDANAVRLKNLDLRAYNCLIEDLKPYVVD